MHVSVLPFVRCACVRNELIERTTGHILMSDTSFDR